MTWSVSVLRIWFRWARKIDINHVCLVLTMTAGFLYLFGKSDSFAKLSRNPETLPRGFGNDPPNILRQSAPANKQTIHPAKQRPELDESDLEHKLKVTHLKSTVHSPSSSIHVVIPNKQITSVNLPDDEIPGQRVFQRRISHMQEYCQDVLDKRRPAQKSRDWLMVDDTYKSIYCNVSKVASKSWKYSLIRFHYRKLEPIGDLNRVHGPELMLLGEQQYLSNYSKPEKDQRLKTYFKYMLTRHPFSRLVSAYLDKMVISREPYYKDLAARIKRQFRDDRINTDDVLFTEFVRYLLSLPNPEEFDRHWIPMVHACQPCYYSYDFIARLENMDVEGPALLNNIGFTPSNFMKFFFTYHKGGFDLATDLKFMEWYKQLTLSEYEALVRIYYDDMMLFRYEIPPYPGS